jgi:hypothetical protein
MDFCEHGDELLCSIKATCWVTKFFKEGPTPLSDVVELTSQSSFLEKLTVTQLIKKFTYL